MNATSHRLVLGLITAFAMAGCTMKSQEAPPLTGPSEFGTSITIAVSPDVLQTDGGSQSVVTITARGTDGQPLRNVSMRAEIRVDGLVTDFGTLSARNVVTDAQGRATLVYTAPAVTGGVDTGLRVDIAATPVSNSYGDNVARVATIRLVPTGVVVPPDGLQPNFTFTPSNALAGEGVFFESTSSAPALNPISSYRWDFGDGGTATGKTATHAYSKPGTFFAQLTITDSAGRSAFTTKSVTIGATLGPTANFVNSPTDPIVNDPVNFNASASTATTGRKIVSYTWDFGDGTAGSGVQASHTYTLARNYTVTLTVKDDFGNTNTVSRALAVK
jgi:PKD repeat protein